MLFLTSTVFPQSAAIKTDKGILFVHNGEKKSFTVEIVGKKVKTVRNPNPLFTVDGNSLRILNLPFTNFTYNPEGKTHEELLELHKIWESDYLSKEFFKAKLTIETRKMNFGKTKAIFWNFKRPSVNQEFDADYFLTTIIGDHLIGFVLASGTKMKKAQAQTFLGSLMKSLKISDKPYDIDKLSEQFRKGKLK